MSLRAIALATVEQLRKPTPDGQTTNCVTDCGIGHLVAPENIGVRPPPGRPPAMAGEVYVAVWCPSWSNRSKEGLVEEYGVNVTVSRRAPVKPDDRYHELLTDWPRGLWAIAEAIRSCLHLNYYVTTRANQIIDDAMRSRTGGAQTDGDEFAEPLYLTNGGTVEEKSGNWFKSGNREQSAALVQTIQFQPAVRAQDASSTTI